MRGYFGIGIEDQKTPSNLGTLWRSAYNFGAAFIFTIHRRHPWQPSDTVKAERHIPYVEYSNIAEFFALVPKGCEVVGIEQSERAKPLDAFKHTERAVYLLGAEDSGLSLTAQSLCHRIVSIDSFRCLNVVIAGSIVMWHRQTQLKTCGEREVERLR